MKKALGFCATIAAAALGLLWLGSAGAQPAGKPTVIRYALALPIAEYLPFYLAQDKGYFKEENLAVESVALGSGDKLTLALVGGSVEITAYTPDWFIRAVEKGDAKIKMVLGGSNVPVYSLVVSKDVNSYGQLKGKRLAVSTLKASDAYLLRKMLGANGLRDVDYALIQAGGGGDRAAALKAGSVAGTLMIPPFDQRLVDEGYKRLDVSTNVLTEYNWISHAVREDWAKANRPALVGFIRGWIKATRFIFDPKNKEDAVRVLAKELKLEDRYARNVYDLYLDPKTPTFAKDGEMPIKGMQVLIGAMGEQGDLPQPLPKAEKYIDATYWEEARRTLR